MRTEDLIEQMAEAARPVRRLPAPSVQAAAFVAAVLVLVGIVVAWQGVRPDLADQLRDPSVLVPWLASIATGLLAVLAAAHLAAPDRPARWRWLPLPAFLLWLATLGAGCFGDWLRRGAAAWALPPGTDCLPEIVAVSLPLTVLLLLWLRHAAPIRPLATAITGALAVASFASAGMELFHPADGALTVLVWHAGVVLLVVAAFGLSGRSLFRLIGPRAPRFAR